MKCRQRSLHSLPWLQVHVHVVCVILWLSSGVTATAFHELSENSAVVYPPSAMAPNPRSGGIVDVTAPPYGADPTGATDAAPSLTRAYNDIWLQVNCSTDASGNPPISCLNSANQRVLYFPPGTYRLTRTLEFTAVRRWGLMSLDNMIHFQGHSASSTVLRLDLNAAGFDSPATSGALVSFIHPGDQSNVAMMNTFKDLTIDTGVLHPYANALRFTANNCGAVRRVTLRGQGHVALVRVITHVFSRHSCSYKSNQCSWHRI